MFLPKLGETERRAGCPARMNRRQCPRVTVCLMAARRHDAKWRRTDDLTNSSAVPMIGCKVSFTVVDGLATKP